MSAPAWPPGRDSVVIGPDLKSLSVKAPDDMTDKVRHMTWMALLVGGALLQGCGEKAAEPAGSRLRVYAADVTGKAKICEAPMISPAPGKTVDTGMKLDNDGGWCGLAVHQAGPKPFDAGLLTARPAHGSVTIHSVGDETRTDYVPDRGFAGTDAFTVELLPGAAVLHVAVTVAGT
jgi:hypothetical protein